MNVKRNKRTDKQRRKDPKKLMKRATKLAAAKREHDEILAREVLTIYKIKPTEYRKMLQNTNSEYSIGYTKENLLE